MVAAESSAFADAVAPVLDLFFGSPLKLAGTLGASFASYQVVLYWRLQYLLAAHLSNNVKPGARVVEYGVGTGKNLYCASTRRLVRPSLYVSDFLTRASTDYNTPGSVYGVGPDANESLLQQIAAQAAVPLTVQASAYSAPLKLATASVDAVVSVDALSKESDPTAAVAEAARVLRPGSGQLLFFEGGSAPNALTRALETSGLFQSVRYDRQWASMPLSQRAIGIALRSNAALPPSAAGGGAAASAAPAKEPRRPRGVSAPEKGFGKRP